MRVRDDDDGQAEGGHLGQRRGAGPTDDEIRGGQRRQHVVAQERVRPVPIAPILGQRLAGGQGRRVAVLARHVDDGDPLDQPRQGRRHGAVEAADGLRPAEDQQDPQPGGHAQSRAGRLAVHLARVADRRAGDVARTSGCGGLPSATQVASKETASTSARRAVARTARPGITLPSHSTTGMPSGAAARRTGTAT